MVAVAATVEQCVREEKLNVYGLILGLRNPCVGERNSGDGVVVI